MFPSHLTSKAHALSALLKEMNLKITAAESCTGGLIAAILTDLPGASEIFDRGFVTYSNQSKIDLLTVPTFFIEDYGSVSRQTAIAMAEGALLISRANISVAVTGVAGPDGGTENKPVGTVFISVQRQGKATKCEKFQFDGSRHAIRLKTVEAAMAMCIDVLEKY
jgi:nicotinamide-nucleotide amidase